MVMASMHFNCWAPHYFLLNDMNKIKNDSLTIEFPFNFYHFGCFDMIITFTWRFILYICGIIKLIPFCYYMKLESHMIWNLDFTWIVWKNIHDVQYHTSIAFMLYFTCLRIGDELIVVLIWFSYASWIEHHFWHLFDNDSCFSSKIETIGIQIMTQIIACDQLCSNFRIEPFLREGERVCVYLVPP